MTGNPEVIPGYKSAGETGASISRAVAGRCRRTPSSDCCTSVDARAYIGSLGGAGDELREMPHR